jgi:hypothetical protein
VATFIDQIITEFRLTGQAEYVQGLRDIATFAQASNSPILRMRTANQANHAELLLGIGIVSAYVAGFKFLVNTFESSIELVRQHERAFARLSQELHNADINHTAQEWYGYAQARQEATGIDRDATAALATQLIQLGYNRDKIREYLEILQNAQAEGIGRTGEGTDPRQIATSIANLVRTGRSQGLVKFGIDIDEVKKSVDQIDDAFQQLKLHTQGNIDVIVQTTSGQFDVLSANWKSVWQDFLDASAPFLKGFIEAMKGASEGIRIFLVEPLQLVNRLLGYNSGTEQTAATVAAQNRQIQTWDEMNASGKETARNTRKMADSIVAATLGAAGTIVKETATIRNLNQAIKIGG